MDDFDTLLENPSPSEETNEAPEFGQAITTENEEEEETTETSPTQEEGGYDPVIAFLNSRGVKDSTKIPFINENGETEELDFNSLTPEEKFEILNELATPDLSEEEIKTIDYLRKYRLTFEQAIDYFANQRLENYLKEHPEDVKQKQYSVDEYSDDDLFVIDLHNRFPDFTDEELNSELEAAKENEEFFAKKVNAIRTSYKELEDQSIKEQQQREALAAENLRNNLMDVANRFNEIQLDYKDETSDSLIIEPEDKQKVISYLMDMDSDGKSAFIKDIENPEALFELGWLRTQGAEVLSNTAQYWKSQLADAREKNKKLQAKLDKYEKKNNNSTVVRSPEDNRNETAVDYWDSTGIL